MQMRYSCKLNKPQNLTPDTGTLPCIISSPIWENSANILQLTSFTVQHLPNHQVSTAIRWTETSWDVKAC